MYIKKDTVSQKNSPIIEQYTEEDIMNNRVISAVSYIWLLFLIPLFFRRSSKFAQFHAKQGLVLFLVEVVGTFFFWIPFIGQLLFLLIFMLAIAGFVMALSGRAYELPVLSGISKQIHL